MNTEPLRDLQCHARLLAAGMLLSVAAAAATPDPSGRWQGTAEIPGAPMRLFVDIAQSSGGEWAGSVVLPGRDVKGAPLKSVQASDGGVRLDLTPAFRAEAPGATVEARLEWQGDGTLAGELRQGGHAAPLRLQRIGPAQVDLPTPDTPVSPLLEGTWQGRYELDGYPRDVTLKIANRGIGGVATGELVVVGRRTTTLAVDHVRQGSEFIVIRASAADFRIEGHWSASDGSIRGQMAQGPFEAPLVLHKVEPAVGGKS